MNKLAPSILLKALAIIAALALLYLNVLSKLGLDCWNDQNYSHSLLVPLIIAYILWIKRDDFISVRKKPSLIFGGMTIIFSLLLLWAGIAGAELFLQRLSLIFMLVGVVIYFWGFELLPQLAAPIALLLLAIPVPAIVLNKITFPLQLFASRCAVWAMRSFNIPVLREGNVIELMPLNSTKIKKLEVVEACSGIRSLMTLMTLAVVLAYFTWPKDNFAAQRGRWPFHWLRSYGFWRAGIIIASAVPIAVLTNALRVSATGVLARYFGTEIADGFFHSFSGWVMYVVALGLLMAVSWSLDKVKGMKESHSRKIVQRLNTQAEHTAIITPVPTEGVE